VQYNAPWFRFIAANCPEIELTVVYAARPRPDQQGAGFDVPFEWDTPLLEGYAWHLVREGEDVDDFATGRFRGLDVPSIGQAVADTRPDIVLVPGWHSVTFVRALLSARRRGVQQEGRLLLGDQIAKYLPPLAALKVAQDGGRVEGRAPKRAPTVQDLLRHTSGLTYSERGSTPAHKAYPGSSIVTAERMDKDNVIAALAKAPLLFDPGSDWEYGFSTDVLGFIVEAVTGTSLGDFLAQRLWSPLGMSDTSFALPAGKRARYALALPKDPVTGNANTVAHHATDKTQKWESGGGGTVSTAPDYLRFAEMLRSGGKLGSAEILGRGTVALMTADHLPASFNNMIADKMDPAATGYGFGLGVAVRRQDGIAAMAGSAGDFYWSGVYGTYFWVDPKEELVGVYMSQAPSPSRAYYRKLIKQLVYSAIVD
jgi:CubicO group peptidase (beta-lactamase class C family)